MEFVPFPESNRVLGKPATMTDAECSSLPVYADGRQCISCWRPSPEELAALNAGQPLYLGVLTTTNPSRPVYTQPPVFLTVGKPDMPPVQYTLTPDIEADLRKFAACLPITGFADRPLPGAVLARKYPALRTWQEGGQLEQSGSTLYYVSSPEAQAEHFGHLCDAYRHGGQPAVVDYLRPFVHFLNAPDSQPLLCA